MAKFYNVVSCRTVGTREERKIYHKVGVIKVTGNGGWFLQLYHQPDVTYQVFPNGEEELPVIEFGNDEA